MSWQSIKKASRFVLQGIVPQWGEDRRGIANTHDYNQVVGYESKETGSMVDAMQGLDSDGRRYFAPDEHQYNPLGEDSMRLLQNDARVLQYWNDSMWDEREDEFQWDIASAYPSGEVLRPGPTDVDESWLE